MQGGVQGIDHFRPIAIVLYRLTQETGLRGRPERGVMQGNGMRERGVGLQKTANLFGLAIQPKLFEKRLK